MAKSTGFAELDALLTARKGHVDFVDVPELAFLSIDGTGAPDGQQFQAALRALYAVSYGAHFLVKKQTGAAPRVMPLEALWWMEGVTGEQLAHPESFPESDRDAWRWRAMIAQLPPIDEAVVRHATEQARAKGGGAIDALRFERWAEGPSAQIMHVGPYSTESTSIAALHAGIAAHGSRPRGRHHEIYLGDPRSAAPERLRTILRQPVEPAA
ncbi:GyrI-like domain-containing protein [Lacisediminihabitans profunda]|uniref:GyrI-like domain-containing protein n=1 Tax=Lacisediminihabitans profunda TaxID=2594790 RepID=UPI00164FA1AC|nr:GyrI-like domain-containing protein [Lacisediminihabitans profunda]